MKKLLIILLIAFSALFYCSCKESDNPEIDGFLSSGSYKGEYWPTDGWRSCSPEEVRMNSDLLYRVYEYVSRPEHAASGIAIIKDGYIVAEQYFQGHDKTDRFHSYSVAKSFLSALIGIAIDEEHINNVNDYAYQYLVEWQNEDIDERKRMITVRHLLAMSSGILFNEDYADPDNDINRMVRSGDYLTYMLNQPMQYEPWRYWQYVSGNSILLSGILQRAAGMNAYTYGIAKMFTAIGTPDIIWYSDDRGLTAGGWGINATIREYAKFGYLYLKNGEWDGQQVVSSEWIEISTRPIASTINFYGLHWWLLDGFNGFEGSGLPEGIYMAMGIHGQTLYILPGSNTVIVKTANTIDPQPAEWDHTQFLSLVLDSMQ